MYSRPKGSWNSTYRVKSLVRVSVVALPLFPSNSVSPRLLHRSVYKSDYSLISNMNKMIIRALSPAV